MITDWINATSTATIAIFTIVLAWVSYRQTQLIQRSLDLAREEHNASHRPHLIVRDVYVSERNVSYQLTNKGDATAKIVESHVTAAFVPDDETLRPLPSSGHNDLNDVSLAAGESIELTYSIPSHTSFAMMFPAARRIGIEDKPAKHGHIYFAGTIVYEDTGGRRRRSVFRRVWNDTKRTFDRVNDPDQEYAD